MTVNQIYDYLYDTRYFRRIERKIIDIVGKGYIDNISSDGDDLYVDLKFNDENGSNTPTIVYYSTVEMFANRNYSYDQIDQFIVDAVVDKVAAYKDKMGMTDVAESYVDIEIAELCDMRYGEVYMDGIHAAYWKPGMSYGNDFKYGDYFTVDKDLSSYCSAKFGLSKVFRYNNDNRILLVASPGFNFLTTEQVFCDDLKIDINETHTKLSMADINVAKRRIKYILDSMISDKVKFSIIAPYLDQNDRQFYFDDWKLESQYTSISANTRTKQIAVKGMEFNSYDLVTNYHLEDLSGKPEYDNNYRFQQRMSFFTLNYYDIIDLDDTQLCDFIVEAIQSRLNDYEFTRNYYVLVEN